MGNIVQTLSAGATLVAGADTWIEGDAIQQLHTTSRLPGMQRVVGLPDLHPGRGYPVGAAFFSLQQLYPALVGNDIGCGMALWQTGLSVRGSSADKLVRRLGNIDGPLGEAWDEDIAALGLAGHPHRQALGSIGGGNHFAELQRVEHIADAEACAALGLDAGALLLLVHSGSRGLGQAILQEHVSRFGHQGLAADSAAAHAYLAAHDGALDFARANRELIARRMLARWGTEGRRLLDLHHNLVQAREVDGVAGWLHRKGASPADAGVAVIPGSRGDHSYLVLPQADPRSLYSLAHGAGRKWQRSQCRERLARRFSAAQLTRTALGSRVVCADKELLFEEAPEAYKSVAAVVEPLQQAGLLRVLARLSPVLTYKTGGGTC